MTPARAASGNTVGASNIADRRWALSNFGPAIDFFAPGERVVAPTVGSDTAMAARNGTSLACPHVCLGFW